MRRNWYLLSSRGEWEVRLVEEPLWAIWAESAWNGLCWFTGGWLGGHGMPEWLWKVPVGWPHWNRTYPKNLWLTNSIPAKLMDLEHWFGTRTFVHGRLLALIPIDLETARRLSPKFVQKIEQLDEEEGT